jgi:hypothetical protein
MSAADIDPGARWSVEVASQLDSANVGIICLTPENIEAPWIMFEAGALSKVLSRALVCTYLFQLRPADLKGPLAQFQATVSQKSETKQLLTSMNKALGQSMVPETRLDKMFEHWWPELAAVLESVAQQKDERATPRRPERDILEELLTLQRRNDQRKLAPELAEHIMKLLRTNGLAVRNRKDQRSTEPGRSGTDSTLVIDTTPLVGAEGREVNVRYPVFGSVSDLLDEIYLYLAGTVPASSFGSLWALRERGSGKLFKDMGRTWARTALNNPTDYRPLEEVGINPGMELEVIPLTA